MTGSAAAQAPGIAAGGADGTTTRIPPQLMRDDLRFIRMPWGSKGGSENESGWNATANYAWNDAALGFYLADNWNYGIFPSAGSPIVIFDADEHEILKDLGCLQGIDGRTFTVASGSSTPEKKKNHYYISCPGLAGKTVLNHPTMLDDRGRPLHLGEIFAQSPDGAKGYVIGPSCRHPKGGTYTIATDLPILAVSKEELDELLSGVNVSTTSAKGEPVKPHSAGNGNLVDTLGIRIEDECKPDGAHRVGDEIVGGHPIHGSDTKTNLSINPGKGVWRCHRHSTGGDALVWIAVQDGIIDCSQAGPGCLDGHWPEVFGSLKTRGYELPAKNAVAVAHDDSRKILVTNVRLRDVSDQTVARLVASNDPPWLFVRTRGLARVGADNKTGLSIIERLDEHSFKGILERVSDYVRLVPDKKIWKEVLTSPSKDLVWDILSLGRWTFPLIDAITQTPIIHNDGTIVVDAGYDPETMVYYSPVPGTKIPTIPDTPTPEDVKAAVELIKEPFKDFPFVDETSRTHIIAALLTVVLRPTIPGIVPATLIDKPAPGTGASLIASIITAIVQGGEAVVTPAPKDEDGWRKIITSILKKGGTLVNVDNVENKLYSPSLSALLTARMWEDRILGQSEMITLPNHTVWILNGNNLSLGGDLPRRCVWARMDAKIQRPWQREGAFTHADVVQWTKDRRGELLGAIVVIVRHWVKCGCPGPAEDVPKLGGYEPWRNTVGGILNNAGFIGFLGNLEELYSEMDVDGTQWDTFIARWYMKWGEEPHTVADLIKQINLEKTAVDPVSITEFLPDDLGEALAGKGSPAHKVGRALARKKDRVFTGGLTFVTGHIIHSTLSYKVKPIGKETPQTPLPESKPESTPDDNTTGGLGGFGGFGLHSSQVKEKSNTVNIISQSGTGARETPQTPLTPLPKNTLTIESILSSLRGCGINQVDIPSADKWTKLDIGCSCLVCHVESHKDGPVMKDRTGRPTVHRVKTGVAFWEGRGEKRRVGPLCDTCKNTILGVQP